MTKKTKIYINAIIKNDINNEKKIIAFNIHVLKLITRNIKNHQNKYLKIKTIQYTETTQTFTYIINKLQKSTDLHNNTINFIANIKSNLYVIINNIYTKKKTYNLIQNK